MRKIVRISVMALCAALLLASCNRRPLEEMVEKIMIKVTVNLDGVSNVTKDIYNPAVQIPNTNTDMLRVMVYDHETGNLVTQTFISDKSYDSAGHQVISGTLNISYGTYDIVVYNFDTPSTLIQGENNEGTITAYTSSLSDAAVERYIGGSSYTGTVTYEPDHTAVSRDKDYHISVHSDLPVLETTAYTEIDTYYFQIPVSGLEYVASATAVITGLCPSNQIGTGDRTTTSTTAVPFELIKSTDPNRSDNQDVLCGIFNTFGHTDGTPSKVIITVVDTAGNTHQYEYVLDNVFRTEDAIEHNWLLLDSGIEIDDPTPARPQNGGFQPEVDDWEEVHGDIVL